MLQKLTLDGGSFRVTLEEGRDGGARLGGASRTLD
jgi:hypothetical protein